MEIIITKSEVKVDDYNIYHTLYFKHNGEDRKMRLKCYDYTDNTLYHYLYIYNSKEEIYEYVGNVFNLWDDSEEETECSKKDKELSMKIVWELREEGFSFEGEDRIDYQCNFNLPHKLELSYEK